MRMRLKEYDAGSYYRILNETKKRYLIQTMTMTFTTKVWESQTLCEEYHVPKSIQNGFDNSVNQVLNVSTVDSKLFKTSEMKILVTWYQIFIKDRDEAMKYLKTLENQPKALIFVMASISEDLDLFDFIDYHVKGEKCNTKTMSEDLVNYGYLKANITDVKNLILEMGLTLERALDVLHISDDKKLKIMEELSKTDD